MLKIDPKQVAAFEDGDLEKFKQDLFDKFRFDYPDYTQRHDDDALKSIIDKSTADGIEFGLKTRRGMTQFVSLAVFLDPDLLERQEVQDLIGYSGFNADDKMEMLSEVLKDRLRSGDLK